MRMTSLTTSAMANSFSRVLVSGTSWRVMTKSDTKGMKGTAKKVIVGVLQQIRSKSTWA